MNHIAASVMLAVVALSALVNVGDRDGYWASFYSILFSVSLGLSIWNVTT